MYNGNEELQVLDMTSLEDKIQELDENKETYEYQECNVLLNN